MHCYAKCFLTVYYCPAECLHAGTAVYTAPSNACVYTLLCTLRHRTRARCLPHRRMRTLRHCFSIGYCDAECVCTGTAVWTVMPSVCAQALMFVLHRQMLRCRSYFQHSKPQTAQLNTCMMTVLCELQSRMLARRHCCV